MPAPATKSNIQAPLAPLWELNERIIYHSAEDGRLLYGLKYDFELELKVIGETNLPMLQPSSATVIEGAWAGQSRTPGAIPNVPVLPVITAQFRLVVNRKAGWFRRDPVAVTAANRVGVIEWYNRIVDAFEKTRSATPSLDSALDGTCNRPIQVRMLEDDTTQVGVSVIIEVEMTPLPHCRGERSRLFGAV